MENFHIQKVENTYEAKNPHTHEYFQIYYIAPEAKTVFYSFSFMPDFLNEANPDNKLVSLFLRNLLTEKQILPKVSIDSKDIFYIESVMERMLDEFTCKNRGFGEVIHSYTVLLLTVLARNYFEKNTLTEYFDNSKQFVLHCVEYIENNFTEQITLNEISKRSAMSKNSFCELFYKLTGHSFNNYLNMCRIKKATEYIKDGYKPAWSLDRLISMINDSYTLEDSKIEFYTKLNRYDEAIAMIQSLIHIGQFNKEYLKK